MSDPQDSIVITALLSLIALVVQMGIIVDNTIPRNFRATVVKVQGTTGHGSGSVIKTTDKKSYILTNRHVCDGVAYTQEEIEKLKDISRRGMVCFFSPESEECNKIRSEYDTLVKSISGMGRKVDIIFNNYKNLTLQGTIVKISKKYDLCLVEVDHGNLPEMQLSRNSAVPGQRINSIGNPLYMTNAQTEGFVGDTIEYEGNHYQHHTGIIYGGNSGGPVVDAARGELLGVNTLGTPHPTASFMIPLEDIKDFLKE